MYLSQMCDICYKWPVLGQVQKWLKKIQKIADLLRFFVFYVNNLPLVSAITEIFLCILPKFSMLVSNDQFSDNPVNTKQLYSIYSTSAQRLWRWSNIV